MQVGNQGLGAEGQQVEDDSHSEDTDMSDEDDVSPGQTTSGVASTLDVQRHSLPGEGRPAFVLNTHAYILLKRYDARERKLVGLGMFLARVGDTLYAAVSTMLDMVGFRMWKESTLLTCEDVGHDETLATGDLMILVIQETLSSDE